MAEVAEKLIWRIQEQDLRWWHNFTFHEKNCCLTSMLHGTFLLFIEKSAFVDIFVQHFWSKQKTTDCSKSSDLLSNNYFLLRFLKFCDLKSEMARGWNNCWNYWNKYFQMKFSIEKFQIHLTGPTSDAMNNDVWRDWVWVWPVMADFGACSWRSVTRHGWEFLESVWFLGHPHSKNVNAKALPNPELCHLSSQMYSSSTCFSIILFHLSLSEAFLSLGMATTATLLFFKIPKLGPQTFSTPNIQNVRPFSMPATLPPPCRSWRRSWGAAMH